MPSVSAAQHRAMEAAAHGHSTLGIPEKVGKEFVRADGGQVTDREIAEAIRDGARSPQRVGDFWLFDLRITGTGAAYRPSLGEYAVRDPDTWLTDDLVDRCAGLPVVFGHPGGPGLNAQEWRERSIGTVVLPYRTADEVRGVAKVFDADAALLMTTTHRSTSPGVRTSSDAKPVELPNGDRVLDEPLPLIFDHIAICESGVWDKGGPPEGVRVDPFDEMPLSERSDSAEPKAGQDRKDTAMADEKEDWQAKYDAVCKERDDAMARADAAEKAAKEREDARKDARKDADKKDAEEKDEAADKEDAEEKGEAADKEKEEREAKKDAARKDGAAETKVEATEAAIKDAADIKVLAEQVKRLQARLAGIERVPDIDDRNAIAAAHKRADSIYAMHGLPTPDALHGERPLAYRQRLAAGLRRFSDRFKDYTIADSLDATAFGLIEGVIYDDAAAAAKRPTSTAAGVLRASTTNEMGKTFTRFHGDPRAAWAPFMPPVQSFITGFNNRPGQGV